ncbi:GNAT family N-acetyltransferase [Francisella hispaniensis]|uniref:Lipid carrier: UDP-N-acetylgalactosaminyltransferase n=1 Tax=Francisella hispaniensis TaxID=622488 RepID=F4BH54_9GAMM|nr:GNAT family N-acetyltransferase [Francisella hispaniensis]AEE26798.1 Lipid carrier : UDP-N-acetylgalactosaminyltransferase [Francisella hispaniensis]
MPRKTLYTLFFKRVFDFILSLIALVILSPVILILAILIRFKLGSPVLFKQPRPGKDEKIFNLYKFRTMTDARDKDGNLLPDSDRLTKFGKFIRSTSLDELPSLINILKGNMSIVGPRPLLVKYLPYYRKHERKRSLVRPGITGLAQINGRNALSWSRRFEMDLEYVRKICFILDLQIILKTVKKIFKREDILVGDEHILENLDVERSYMTSNSCLKYLTVENIVPNRERIVLMLSDNLRINFPELEEVCERAESYYLEMLKYVQNDEAIVIGAFANDILMGFIWGYCQSQFPSKKYHISHIVVDKKLRSSGIGSRLIESFEEYVISNGGGKLDLFTSANNLQAIDFYRQKKFIVKRLQLEKIVGER